MNVNVEETYPGSPLRLGDTNQHIFKIKVALNAISSNFTAIPKITPVDDVFNESMENTVKEFQRIYNMPVTGIVDKATWYEIRKIYAAVRKLAETTAQGELVSELPTDIIFEIEDGEVIPRVQFVQYFLNVLSAYYDSILPVDINGMLDLNTITSIIEFQKTMGLPTTGMIGEKTWDTMYRSVLGILKVLPPTAVFLPAFIYPNTIFREGMEAPGVLIIQELLSYISSVVPPIPNVESDGIFGPETKASVIAFQRLYGTEADGTVDEDTWNKIISVYQELRFGALRSPGQFSGTDIK